MNKRYMYICKNCGYVEVGNNPLDIHICPQCSGTNFSTYEDEENETPSITTPTVECPYCHSTNTKKSSGLAKGLKVAFWGNAAAGQIAKQWHCNNCGSDF